MAKNRNTYQKGQREMEKKRKAEEKRNDKLRRKAEPRPTPPARVDIEPNADAQQ